PGASGRLDSPGPAQGPTITCVRPRITRLGASLPRMTFLDEAECLAMLILKVNLYALCYRARWRSSMMRPRPMLKPPMIPSGSPGCFGRRNHKMTIGGEVLIGAGSRDRCRTPRVLNQVYKPLGSASLVIRDSAHE